MFTRKKRFYQRKLFYVVIAALLAFGYWMMPNGSAPDENIGTNVKYPVDQNADKNNSKPNLPAAEDSNVYGAEKTNDDANDNKDAEAKSSEYYLVKEVDGVIKVFHYDAQGNEKQLQNTDILFSLLSESDQEMFSKGVVVNTEEELTNLMQDFES